MDTLSPEKAREIVEEIRINNGGLREEVQRSLHAEALRSIRNLQSLAGASIRHVAEDLYDADTRFIFELVQNAEDSRYSHAKSQEEEPFIYFTLYPDRITVDTNEDGFTENDVRAICSIHNSSKRQIGGYIGHKGIGFKSVFKVAHKVHIQSGPFCFSFTHRKGESGMGMITPFSREPEDLPPNVKTRFTLYFIHPEDFQIREGELKEIPDTLLLFLRRLCKIGVKIEPSGFRLLFKREQTGPNGRITLVKEAGDVVSKRIYHVEGAEFENLPEHGDQSAQTTAEVILAFPVDDSHRPIIEPQHVYSFLPMRQEGFKFLIQSDFITTANRQGVHLCPRNYAIRERISLVFVQAVYNFCKNATLKYEWLQYLPGPSIPDPFWATLRDMILESLSESKILLTRSGALDCPKSLQHPSSRHCDLHGQPLLDDITPEVYMSEGYNWPRHAELLTELRVTNLSFKNILDRLDPYLVGSTPRLFDVSLDDDWHARLAGLLLRGLSMYGAQIRERVESMALIPSSYGVLLSASSGDIHFPVDDQGRAIPGDLTLKTVDVKISQDTPRWKLFEALGVSSCSSQKVVNSILRRYDSPVGVTLRHSIDHLKYLFWVGSGEILDKRIFVMDQMERRVYRAFVTFGVHIIRDDVYFATDGEYGTKKLSQKLRRRSNQQNSFPVEIYIIHDAYLGALPPSACPHGLTWERWLQVTADVRRVPKLFDPFQDRLLPLGQHFSDYHPTTFIGILKTYWSSYNREMTSNIIRVLECMLVPGRYTQERSPLCRQYYPSNQLLDLCSRAGVTDNFAHFLQVPDDLVTDTSDEWEFLSTFRVGLRPDIRFFRYIFSSLTADQTINAQRIEGLFRMYEELSIRFPTDVDAIKREIFDKTVAVCIPKTRIGTVELAPLSDCVWEGNQCLRTCHALALFPEYTENRHITYLFRDMLKLPSASLITYLYELVNRKEEGHEDDLCVIYDMISQLAISPNERGLVLDTIRTDKLIYISSGQLWVGPESCVWAEAPKIGGKYGISAAYSQHQALFQGLLDIQVPTINNYVAQLKMLASDATSRAIDFKTAMYSIHSMCPKAGDIEDLRDLQFLPVQMPNGNIEILRPVDTFFFSDTLEYQSTFHGKAPLLKISLEEHRKLYRVLEALGLEDRYISTIVEERVVVEQMEPEPSRQETRFFQRKAKHLYRCALHYNPEIEDNKVPNLRQQLQRAVVHESSGFKRILVLQLKEFTVTADCDNGLVHIESNNNNMLRIYVPRDPNDRKQCYLSHLPNTLARFLGLKDREARLTFQLVFLSPGSSIESQLDCNGIAAAPVEDLPSVGSDASDDSEPLALSGDTASEDGEVEDTPVRVHTPPSSSETALEVSSILGSENFELGHRSRQPSYQVETAGAFVTSRQASARSSRPFTVPVSPLALPDDGPEPVPPVTQFAQLLCSVIRLGRQATLPEASQVPANASNGDRNTTTRWPFGVRSENQLAHDIKIGAAGELYVFELLQTLNLPGFGRHNWKSTIRREVTVHPDYQDLAPWNGSETADLVFDDSSSALTSLLIRAGYLSPDSWRGARPTYYIEVKTTTGDNNTRFFMSKSQYQRMQRMQIEVAGAPNDEIYMIFRVYHLDKESIGVQIYLDPESLRQEGRLIFTAESYSVVPGQL
ncbi:hypothetical protein I7I53_00094 [Histoplasma capsulatum var. duboisii H88]|uniref:Protein NO VEIN C-terminal domain-containing protein n=1 Tax=Ajellomyces capsulatus (strain H88) TaxID=544711 RepID=A0A8A1LGF9_AJEC8|nr:hypothetical protein I7I53_00094 [Histoplasma capsulatum var. duboisii H88]